MTLSDGLQTAATIWIWLEIVGVVLGLAVLVVGGYWVLRKREPTKRPPNVLGWLRQHK